VEYKKGQFYFLEKGFCRILDPFNMTYIQDKFVPRSIHSSFWLKEYTCPNFIILNKIDNNILIFYENKFGILIDHLKIKLKQVDNE
jgi:hypothetical protein